MSIHLLNKGLSCVLCLILLEISKECHVRMNQYIPQLIHIGYIGEYLARIQDVCIRSVYSFCHSSPEVGAMLIVLNFKNITSLLN